MATIWLCISNKLSPIGTVDVFDCSAGNGNSLSLKKQIAVLLKCVSSFFSMRLIEVQRQAGNVDCCLFAIAFAYTLCCGLDPHTIHFDQSSMRSHYELCVDKEKLDMFPTSSCHWRQITRKRLKFEKRVAVFCACRLPWDKDDVERGPMVHDL